MLGAGLALPVATSCGAGSRASARPVCGLPVFTEAIPEAGPAAWQLALAEFDRRLHSTRQWADATDSWKRAEAVANLYLRRARLTGDFADYAEAERQMARAFERAPSGSGPHLSAAQLSFSLHRLDAARASLLQAGSAILVDDETRAAIEGLLGAVEMESGDYAKARAHFERSHAIHPSVSSRIHLAAYAWKTGDHLESERLFAEAAAHDRRPEPENLAWFHLQRGLLDLDRGRYEEALAHYREGLAVLPQYWLLEEHVAEALALLGQSGEALELYLRVVGRTNNPEFMDAIATLYTECGMPEAASPWIERARQGHDHRLAILPEAAYGHSLEHLLTFGSPAEAVAMAERNRALRPNPEAHIQLAQAYLKAQRPDDAKTAIDRALGTPHRSADLFATAARVYEATSERDTAATFGNLARVIHPGISLP